MAIQHSIRLVLVLGICYLKSALWVLTRPLSRKWCHIHWVESFGHGGSPLIQQSENNRIIIGKAITTTELFDLRKARMHSHTLGANIMKKTGYA